MLRNRLALGAAAVAIAGGTLAAAAPAQAAYNCYSSYQACFYWGNSATSYVWGTGNQGTAPGSSFNSDHNTTTDRFSNGSTVQGNVQSVYNNAPNGMNAYVYNTAYANLGNWSTRDAWSAQAMGNSYFTYNGNVSWHASYGE